MNTYYPLRLAFSYAAYRGDRLIQQGSGETVEMSSAAIKVTLTEAVDPRATGLKLSIAWPAKLDGGTALQFVVEGSPIWDGALLAEVAIQRYEFRTAPKHSSLSVTIPSGAFVEFQARQGAVASALR